MSDSSSSPTPEETMENAQELLAQDEIRIDSSPPKPSTFEELKDALETTTADYVLFLKDRASMPIQGPNAHGYYKQRLDAARSALVSARNEMEAENLRLYKQYVRADGELSRLRSRISELEAERKRVAQELGVDANTDLGFTTRVAIASYDEAMAELRRARPRIAELEANALTAEEARFLIRAVNDGAIWHQPTPEIFAKLCSISSKREPE